MSAYHTEKKQENINKLDAEDISIALKASENIKKMANLLGSKLISKLNPDEMKYILKWRDFEIRNRTPLYGFDRAIQKNKIIVEVLKVLGSENLAKWDKLDLYNLYKNSDYQFDSTKRVPQLYSTPPDFIKLRNEIWEIIKPFMPKPLPRSWHGDMSDSDQE